jgi:hypothetical protein
LQRVVADGELEDREDADPEETLAPEVRLQLTIRIDKRKQSIRTQR